jgi:ABC-type multidrug transport system fused ATPase/permease subunit
MAIDGIGGKWVIYPKVLQWSVDALSRGDTRIKVLIFAALLVAIALVKGVFLYAQRWILIGISREIEFDLRNDLFRKLEEQDSGFYQRYRTGDIMARMTNDLNAGPDVQRQHHLLHRRRAVFPAAHQSLAHSGGLRAHAFGQHPGAVLWQQDS